MYDSAHQIYVPSTVIPLVKSSQAGAGTVFTTFKVKTPDSRLRTKISVIFVPNAGGSPVVDLTAAGSTIWLAEGEEDVSGMSGIILPCTNIEGTQAAPTAFLVAGLSGYSREFVTAADWITGLFTTGTNGVEAGVWYLQTRYQPDGVSFSPAEWDCLIRKTAMVNTGGVKSV